MPLMPQHSASLSTAFSHSLALSRVSEQSSALSAVRQGGAPGTQTGGFTFARILSSSGSLRARTAALGAPIREACVMPEQPQNELESEQSMTTLTLQDAM